MIVLLQSKEYSVERREALDGATFFFALPPLLLWYLLLSLLSCLRRISYITVSLLSLSRSLALSLSRSLAPSLLAPSVNI